MVDHADVPAAQGRDGGQALRHPDLPHAADLRGNRHVAGSVVARSQLEAVGARLEAAVDAVGDQDAVLRRGRDPAVDPGVRRADRTEQPPARFQRRVVEPQLDAHLVADLDAVEQVGPARLVAGRVRVAALDQRVGHVDGGHRPRAVGPHRARLQFHEQPPAEVGRLDRRGELTRPLALARLLVVGGEHGPVEQPDETGVSPRVDPRAQRRGDVGDADVERRLRLERLDVLFLGAGQGRPDPQRVGQGVEPLGGARRLALLEPLGRPGDEHGPGGAHGGVLAGHLRQLAQDAAAPDVQAHPQRPIDPLAVGLGDLVEQPRIVALPPQQLA